MPAERRRDLLERWLAEVVATPGLTAISDPARAREMLLDDALRAAPLVEAESGSLVDVGSGGGSPGLPLAAVLPERDVVLLETEGRKCAFLEPFAREFGNVSVVRGRAEEQPVESYDVALAKALARPPVAVELCLPLVSLGGAALVWVGPSADADAVRRVAPLVGAELEGDPLPGILRLRKVAPTPPGFPRRAGMAKKRPLA